MNHQEAAKLIDRYLSGRATPQEQRLVETWYASQSEKQLLSDDDNFNHLESELFKKTFQRANLSPTKNVIWMWPRIAAAASFVLAIGVSTYFYRKKPPVLTTAVGHQQLPVQAALSNRNKAILTLASGEQIQLMGAKKGHLATDHDVRIAIKAEGEIDYLGGDSDSKKIGYNTLTTPRGSQYNLTLTDGTKIFLNAASSLTYPTAFSGDDRTVILDGEAYFEVAHNQLKPFRVVSHGQIIKVLGTHLNVHSYSDEPIIKTTLLTGSVQINYGNRIAKLKPGQQSRLNVAAQQSGFSVSEGDTEAAIAWKSGFFEFTNSSIKEVMQNAARWYDLNVIYCNESSDLKITGSMSRTISLKALINLLEFEGAKFSINGRNIKVLN